MADQKRISHLVLVSERFVTWFISELAAASSLGRCVIFLIVISNFEGIGADFSLNLIVILCFF